MPAVTVCPGIAVRRDRLNISQLTEALAKKDLSGLGMSVEKLSDLKEMLFTICPNQEWLWSTIDVPERDTIDVDMMLELAMVAPPMNETILGCKGDDNWIPECYKYFQMIFTKDGICYTFNGLSPGDHYREGLLVNLCII